MISISSQTTPSTIDPTAPQVEQGLPAEIYLEIFASLSDRDSLKGPTLLACRLTCSKLKALAERPFLWESYYKKQFLFHDEAREAKRAAELGTDWFRRYVCRRKVDQDVTHLVEEIGATRKGRYERAQTIANIYGRDSWDVLYQMEGRDPPDVPMEDDRWLEQGFWASELRQAMNRRAAIECLHKLRSEEEMSLEEGLSIPSAFFGIAYEEVCLHSFHLSDI